MNAIPEILSSPLAQALGWTLIHSCWQAMLVIFVVIITFKVVASSAQLRYAVACSALLLICLSTIITFIVLYQPHEQNTLEAHADHVQAFMPMSVQALGHPTSLITLAWQQINIYMPLIVMIWMIGALLFVARIITGWMYISRLEKHAVAIEGPWNVRIQQLSELLKINGKVALAESIHVHAPMVVGYFKPMIIIPIGMFSGLTAEQIETIFLHELAHIRRHDFLINLLQTLIEALLFFNPFIWMLSNMIRREREYCCDDMVIKNQGNAMAYVRALAQLESSRLSANVMALSLAENKNQLLNRIKRLMEKSVRNYTGRDRITAVILLVVGLICTSWLSIHVEHQPGDAFQAKADTTIDKISPRNYEETRIITIDENGNRQEQIIKREFDLNDETTQHWQAMYPAPLMPALSGFDVTMTPMPYMGQLSFIGVDTIPGIAAFADGRDIDWETFSDQFENEFKNNFADFYKEHENEFAEMMKKMEENFKAEFHEENYLKEIQQQVLQQEEMDQLGELRDIRSTEMSMLADQMREQADVLRQHHDPGHIRMDEFDRVIKAELLKDGYIGRDENEISIEWDSAGGIKVNGKKIKNADTQKYEALHKKFFGQQGGFGIVE